MVDLGSYTAEVLLAYAVTLVLLAGVVGASVGRARKVRRALEEAEARAKARDA